MQKVEITHKTIIFTVIFILFLQFLWMIKDLVISLFIALIIMSSLKPFVIFLVKIKIPRGLAAFLVYILFIAFFLQIITAVLPPLVNESAGLIKNLPRIFESFYPAIVPYVSFSEFSSLLPNITDQFFALFKGVFSNAVFTISTLFFGFYFLLEENVIKRFLSYFFEDKSTADFVLLFDKAERRLNAWFWGEIVLMTVVGVMTFIGLRLIGVKYAFALAVLAGLFEAIPNIGPVLSSIPAILIAATTSYFLALSTAALYFIVQQLENNFIVPLIMQKAVGLNPIVTLMALIIGGKLAGVLGVLLAIPTTLFLETFLLEFLKSKTPKLR